MGWFKSITRAVVSPIRAIAKPLVKAQKIPLSKKSLKTFNNTYKAIRKIAHAPVKHLPFSDKVGAFVKNPAKKTIPHSVRKKQWYKKYGSKVITYGITAAATAGVGTALGGTAKAIQTAKNIATAVSLAQAAVKARENLQAMQRAKVKAQGVVAEQNQLAAESNQLIVTQKEIAAIKADIKKTELSRVGGFSNEAKKKKDKPAKRLIFNTGGAMVGAGSGFFIAGPIGAVVGGAFGGMIKTKDTKDTKDIKVV